MEKEILGKRVKELRLSNGFSQENLADESALNLRTIQRIESGTTIPRGDTLLRLASALKISPDELLDRAKLEDKGQLLLINLSGLSFILNPFLGLIIPLALWVSKRDKVVNADENGKELLNFQISWLLILSLFIIVFVFYVVSFSKVDAQGTVNSPLAAIICLLFVGFYYSYSIILIIKNTIRIQKDMPVKYKPYFKIIK
ncbi:MAG: DUF4870 domain-containing protein [Paludibacter sp.]